MPTKTEALAKELLDVIDSKIGTFNKRVPAIQKQIFEKLQTLLKDIQLNGDKVANTGDNLRKIGALKSEIEKIVLNPAYIKQVADFAKAFEVVSQLQNQFFSSQVKDFKPKAVLNALKKDAVNSTVISLTEAGISSKVTEGIQGILRTNITGGGKYTDLLEQMRTFITTDERGLGALEKHTRQITTDSLNQYSANYNKMVSSDLGFKWKMYVGSNLATTREFCEEMTAKKFFHVDELPEILKGHIDGHNVRINKKTGLWYGAIAGTTVETFETNRGGWQCGHQTYGVSEAMVPAHLLDKHNGVAPIVPPPDPDTVDVSKKVPIAEVKKLFPNVNENVFQALPSPVKFEFSKAVDGTYYSPAANKINIEDKSRYKKSKWMAENVIYHETGHAVHNLRNIVTPTHVDSAFKTVFQKCQKLLQDKNKLELHQSIDAEMDAGLNSGDYDLKEKALAVFDVLGSLTSGMYGGGHSGGYYKRNNAKYAELFAHGSESFFSENSIFKKHMPEVEEELKKYFEALYSNL